MMFFSDKDRRDTTAHILRRLEERILFDAAMDGGVDPELADASTNGLGFDNSNHAMFEDSTSATIDMDHQDAPATASTRELILIDTGVEDYETIVNELMNNESGDRSFEVVFLDSHADGISQVSAILAVRDDLDAVHLVSHGEEGALRLGNTWIDINNLAGRSGEIALWGNAFTADGDLLIYGCDLAATSDGETLVQSLATLTGADVAASSDDTGDASRGGDWELEYETGEISTTVFASESLQQFYQVILAAGPSVTAGNDQDVMIGESFTFDVVFDNTGTTTGYGPFIDLVFPSNGIDGVAGVGSDGITFVQATYLGQQLNVIELLFPNDGGGTGTIDHPYAVDGAGAPLTVTGTAGDTLVVVELPFGSVTSGQPEVSVQITAMVSNLADVAAPLAIQTRSGFRYGESAVGGVASIMSDSGADVTDASSPATNWSEQISITPTIMTLENIYLGPEDETATGPNFEREYQIIVDIADGQTISSLDVIDSLPNNVVLTGITSVTVGGVAAAYTSNINAMTEPAFNQDLIITLSNDVTGTTSNSDVVVTFSFYVAEYYADGTVGTTGKEVIQVTGEDDTTVTPDSRSHNNARAVGDWNPIDDRDTATPLNPNATTIVAVDPTGIEHTIDDKAIAIQKSVAVVIDAGTPGATPGDTLEYTLTFQISDYFTFGDLVLTDIFQDGQLFDFSFGATLSVSDSVESIAGVFTVRDSIEADTGQRLIIDQSQISLADNAGEDGTTADGSDGSTMLTFDISSMMTDLGASDGVLQGGLSFNDNDADVRQAATGTIRFRTIIQEDYADTFASGDRSVDQGDVITNSSLIIAGKVFENVEENAGTGDITNQLGQEEDNSSASIQTARGTLTKEVYAINGNTTLPMGDNGLPVLVAGDRVTYRITYTLPTSDVEDLVLTDFLPLPIFVANDHNADGTPGDAWIVDFDETNLDAVSGTIELGTNDTFFAESNISPVITVNSSNGVEILYGSYDDTNSASSTIELYLTVTAQNAPTADGLYLTNIVRVSEGTTQETPTIIDRIVQIEVTQPVLSITKGIVDSNATGETYAGSIGPGAVTFDPAGTAVVGAPFTGTLNSNTLATGAVDANITGGIDAGDIVRYVVVVENTGSSAAGAFGVSIADVLPAGMNLVGGSLQVVDGTGAAVAYTGAEADLFTTGITLDDTAGIASIASYDATSGNNVIVLIYDLQATASVGPNEILGSDATLLSYAGQAGGENHIPAGLTDAAQLETDDVSGSKTIVSTEINVGGNGLLDAVIGEIVTFEITFTIPEGTTDNVTIVDTLDSGLRFVNQTNVSSNNINITGNTTANVSNNGRTITWNLGNVTDTNIADNVDGTITFTYEAVVANISSNQQNTKLNNTVTFQSDGSSLASVNLGGNANRVNVVESVVVIGTMVSVRGVANQASGDAGDAIQYVTTITQSGTIDAFDLGFAGALALNGNGTSAILTPTFSVVDSAAFLITNDFEIVGDQANGFSLQLKSGVDFDMLQSQVGRTITITVDGTIASTVTPNQILAFDPEVTWTSLNGNIGNRTPHSSVDTGERDGTNASDNTHNYVADDPINVMINPPTFNKALFTTDQTETTGSNLTIGETATFVFLVTLPEGSTNGLILIDQLPTGMQYVSASVVTTAAASSGLLANDFAGTLPAPTITGGATDGADVTITFGSITTTVDNDGTNNAFLVFVSAIVTDNPANVGYGSGQTTLTNTATLDVVGDGVAAITSNDVNLPIVESNLAITKNIVQSEANAGDTLTVTLTIANTGLGNAYDVSIQDILSATDYDRASVVTVGGGAFTQAGFTANYTAATGTLTYTGGTINAGASATFTFLVDLTDTVATDAVIVNTATIEQATTLDGTEVGERNNPDPDGNNSDTDSDTVHIREHSLAGFVYFDADNDGIKDAGETGIQNVDIRLQGTDHLSNAVDITIQTGADGSYYFGDLRPGTYSITQTQPLVAINGKEYLDGTDTIGTPGGNDLANDTFTNIILPLNSEIDGTNNNFGELEEIELSGFVYHDLDNDGLKDAGEPAIQGVRLTLTGTDDQGVITTQTFDTLIDGSYAFDQLRPGTYTLTQSQITGNAPSGRLWIDGKETDGNYGNGDITVNDVNSSIELVAGNTAINYNFAEVVESIVSGYVFHDTENDGLRTGNVGLGGVTVTLSGINDLGQAINLSTTTSSTVGTLGYYEFANLRPSNGAGYIITQTTPTGYLDGIDTIGSQGGIAVNDAFTSVIMSDIDGTENNFGEILPSSLAGMVFNDKNNDGIFNGNDLPIENVFVTLTGTNDLGSNVNITTQTLADGTYIFTNLRPSDAAGYTLTETQPTNYNDGIHSDGTLANGDTSLSNIITSIDLLEDTDGTAYNFAERGIGIAGTVFVDNNRDGILDIGENVRLDGVRIELWDAADTTMLEFTTTALDGTYLFTDRPAADYIVKQIQPTLYTTTSPNQLNVTLPLTGISGIDFAEALWDIGDTIYFDADGNSTQDAGEPGLGGVGVTLQYAGINGIFGDGDDSSQTTTTDANGNYSFTELFNGNYRIITSGGTLPIGLTGTQETDDSSIAVDGTSHLTILDADRFEIDFGYVGTGSIGDEVWLDINADGTRQTGEIGLANVTINLEFAGFDGVFGNDDDFVLQTQTNAAGIYAFNNLPAGNYRISVDTADPDLPIDIAAVAGLDSILGVAAISLADGEINSDIDFGFAGTLTIGDRIFIDHNADGGVFDAGDGDRGISGVTVSLDIDYNGDGTFDHTLTTTTDANGIYSFNSLVAGDYRVRVDNTGLGANVLTTSTYEIDATADNAALITLAVGTDDLTVDFGYPGQVEYAVTNVSSLTKAAQTRDVFTYEVTVTNLGERDGTGVVVIDSFPMDILDPAGMSTNDPGRASWNFGTGELTWNVGNLDVGQSETIIVTVQVRQFPLDPLADEIITTAIVSDDTLNGPEITLINNIAPTLDELVVFVFDTFNNQGPWEEPGHDDDDQLLGWLPPSYNVFERQLRPAPVDPIFSGLAEPGTTLVLRIYDETGRLIGDRQVVADTGGNWLATFPGSVIWKQPHRMEIEQVASIENAMHDAGFNLRRYFHPATHSSLVMTERPTVSSVLRETAYETVEVMHDSHNDPLQLGRKAHSYQLNTASTNVAGR